MAKQSGERVLTGTYDNVTFYKMEGRYYARMKSSLTSKRVKKDPRFGRTMELAGLFGRANKIASAVYKVLPAEQRGRAARYELIKKCRNLLAEGFSDAAVKRMAGKKGMHLTGKAIIEGVLRKPDVKLHTGLGSYCLKRTDAIVF